MTGNIKDPRVLWLEWVLLEVRQITRTRDVPAAVAVLAQRSGELALADPHIFLAGGVLAVVVLAQEAVAAQGIEDAELTALASMVLSDPHEWDVRARVERARVEVARAGEPAGGARSELTALASAARVAVEHRRPRSGP